MTSPLQPRSHDPALATAVETTLAETQAKPSRMPSLRTWLRGIGAVWILVATVNGTARTSAGFYVGFALFGAAMLGLAGVMKLRAGEKGPGWRIGIATTGVLAGMIATGVGLLSVPWATGALAVGALLGWWGTRLETVGESLTWTPGGDDLRYRDAGGIIDQAEGGNHRRSGGIQPRGGCADGTGRRTRRAARRAGMAGIRDGHFRKDRRR
ncbi:MAG: hypothetical protein IPG05_09510 [Gemmatimonadetes bacterium]|nr:hypothetical protein [Gemmatimonadota bacterium]